jgi:hypothetical protein
MSSSQELWPEPEKLFGWFGDVNLSRDNQAVVVAVAAAAIQKAYAEWYAMHREASARIVELQETQDTTVDKVDGALKAKIKRLEKELRAAREGAGESAGLEHQLLQSQGEVVEWKTRFDELFEMNKRTNRLVDDNNALRGNGGAERVQNTIVHKIKPSKPANFDGSQDLEVVTRYLDEVEHYVRQGASMCPKVSLDNQHMDTVWRFFSVKIFRWFQALMAQRGLTAIPPEDNDYGITWTAFKALFREQFVPEVAVSVVRKEWHALRFSKPQVLKFNRRALELVEILGGSLAISRENPLWEEYLRKLPENIANDVTQQAQIMRRVNKTNLSLGDMMEVVAERTLPFLPATTGLGANHGTANTAGQTSVTTTATTGIVHSDPMDLSNAETEDINIIDEKTKCHRCLGFGHIARDCATPNPAGNRAAQFKSRKREDGLQTERRQPAVQRQQQQRTPRSGQHHHSKRVNTVDDVGSGSGAYFNGEWADECLSEDEGKGPGTVELMGSDCENCVATGKAGQ